MVRPAATSRAAHARPDSRPVTESPRGPPHRSPTTRVLSGRLRPAHHPFPGHTPPDVALEYLQITPIRRTGSLDTSRQRNGPVSGHVSGTYPLIPAYQDLGFATPVRRWRTAWRTACQAAGVPTRFLHDCRRTAACNLIRASVAERVAMLLTGHKSRAIFDRYNIINEQELLDAGD